MRTNPEYAALAYRKAVLQDVIIYLQRQYLGVGGLDPKGQLYTEDLFKTDCEVPEDHVNEVVIDLMLQKQRVQLEMDQFIFGKKPKKEEITKPDVDETNEPTSAEEVEGEEAEPGDADEAPSD